MVLHQKCIKSLNNYLLVVLWRENLSLRAITSKNTATVIIHTEKDILRECLAPVCNSLCNMNSSSDDFGWFVQLIDFSGWMQCACIYDYHFDNKGNWID